MSRELWGVGVQSRPGAQGRCPPSLLSHTDLPPPSLSSCRPKLAAIRAACISESLRAPLARVLTQLWRPARPSPGVLHAQVLAPLALTHRPQCTGRRTVAGPGACWEL